MTFYRSNGDRVPDHIRKMAESAKSGEVDRREFLAMASVFGASTAMAYGLLGVAVSFILGIVIGGQGDCEHRRRDQISGNTRLLRA